MNDIIWPDKCYDDPFAAGMELRDCIWPEAWDWGEPPDGFLWALSCTTHHQQLADLLLKLGNTDKAALALISEGWCRICAEPLRGREVVCDERGQRYDVSVCPCCEFGFGVTPDLADEHRAMISVPNGLEPGWCEHGTIRRSVAPVDEE